jgi:hypothetical protein
MDADQVHCATAAGWRVPVVCTATVHSLTAQLRLLQCGCCWAEGHAGGRKQAHHGTVVVERRREGARLRELRLVPLDILRRHRACGTGYFPLPELHSGMASG